MSETATKHEAFQMKGSLFTMTVLQLIDPSLEKFSAQLKSLIAQAPKFFENAPVVIDLQMLNKTSVKVDFNKLCSQLRIEGIIPVGVRGGTSAHHEKAKDAGLAVMSLSKHEEPELTPAATQSKTIEAKPDLPKPKSNSPSQATDTKNAVKSYVITRPVRSGQQVYAQGGDLVVIGSVSHGAELLADGNIHVYGPLRGRALAGINGNTQARIFCQNMEAELVSIAGCYIVNESLIHSAPNEARQIYLEHGRLQVQPI